MNLNDVNTLGEGISVVIPVFNSGPILSDVLEEIISEFENNRYTYEIICVDDGSKDDSWNEICRIANEYPQIVGIRLSRNFGQHNAVLCGIRRARFKICVTMDDDGQHPPTAIKLMWQEMQKGYDVVYCPPIHERHSMYRNLASKITKMALRHAMGAETAGHVSAYRMFNTNLREAFKTYSGPFVSVDVLLTWGTRKFSAVPFDHRSRLRGASNYTFGKLVMHAFNMITGFSVLPLQAASVVGFFMTLFGLCVLIYVVGRVLLQGIKVPGFAFLASIISIFSGAQLFAIGIFGEYLARMHYRIMNVPSYVIIESTKK